jgi:sugar porter (SP) family MFS transporter
MKTKAPTGVGRFVYIAASISAMGGILFGYDIGVISGAILFIKKQFSLSAGMEEIVVSSVLLGCIAGALVGGSLADRYGRRRLLLVAAGIFIAGAVVSALSPTMAWLVAARVVVGCAIGTASFVAPLYISEIAPVAIRGKLVSLNQLAITCGIVVSYGIDYAFAASQAWRWMFAFAVIPAVAFGFGLLLIPDSPRWLVARGHVDQARTVMKRLRAPEAVEEELSAIQRSAAQQKGHWSELFSPYLRVAMIVGVGLAITQQITGINTIVYYGPTIFKAAGMSSSAVAILASVGVGAFNVVMTVVSLWLIDRVGRRALLLVSLAGMTLSLFVLGLAFLLPGLAGSLGWIAMVVVMLFVGSFALGMGPIFWLLISEMYPLRIRGRAMSVATVANWAANLIVALSFLTLARALGQAATFWLYGAISIGTWIFSFFLVPETKGKSLEQIEAHWRSGKQARAL